MFLQTSLLLGTIACSLAADSVPYSEYIVAPDSRTLYPLSVYGAINGPVINANSLIGSSTGGAIFNGTSFVTYDYGKDIAGLVSVTVGNSSSPDASIGLAYSESSLWISSEGSDMTAGPALDEVLWLPVGNGPGTYTVDSIHGRGGFRYLTLINNSPATIAVTAVSTDFKAAPDQDLRAYSGYFHSNDEMLNRIWYAGAYTNQLCTIDPAFGDASLRLPVKRDVTASQFWFANSTITNGTTCLVDGAKRDREVWPGDLTIQVPSIFVSTNDLTSVKNSLDSLLALQAPSGLLPYAGYPFSTLNIVSFTYHLHSLMAVSNYYHYTGDLHYLRINWDHFTRGLGWSLSNIDSSGLMNVTAQDDWGLHHIGGHNMEANAILYHTINKGIKLAGVLGDTASINMWTPIAATIKDAANKLLWDPAANLYKDNEQSFVYPQDGNTWAIKAGLTLSANQSSQISTALQSRWGPYGAPAPETGSPATVSPYIGGIELEAHLLAGSPQRALDLMRLEWGFMLDDPRMTNSTFIEGYSSDGSLHYPLYTSDAIISHAHGWSTGPTSLLSFYVAGLHLETAKGSTWRIAPQMGDLTHVEAGFVAPAGQFSVAADAANGVVTGLNFETPGNTKGSVELPGVVGKLYSAGQIAVLTNGVATGLSGGKWTLVLDGKRKYMKLQRGQNRRRE